MMNRVRNICWPRPDDVCMEGGCIHCRDSRTVRNHDQLRAYAVRHGLLSRFVQSLDMTGLWRNDEDH